MSEDVNEPSRFAQGIANYFSKPDSELFPSQRLQRRQWLAEFAKHENGITLLEIIEKGNNEQ